MEKLHLQISSDKNNLCLVEQFIDQAKSKIPFNEDLYGNVMIAATESVSNAIEHGNKNNIDKFVNIEIGIDHNKLSLTVSDEGSGYDAETIPDPTLPENLHKTGGRGIFLMKHLSDSINFDQNGSFVTMEFNIQP